MTTKSEDKRVQTTLAAMLDQDLIDFKAKLEEALKADRLASFPSVRERQRVVLAWIDDEINRRKTP